MLELADKALGPLKRISQGSNETVNTLKAARDQLKQLQAVQGDVTSFRTMKTSLGETEAKLKSARDNVRQLAASHALAGQPTKQMEAAMKAARNEAAQLGEKFKSQQQNLQRMRDKLSAAGISTSNLATHDKQLRASIAATTLDITQQTQALKAQGDMQRRASSLKAAQNTNVGNRAQARGALLDGVALAATLGAPIKMAMDWEQRMAELNKVANKTPQELNAIAAAAQALAVETGVAREEIIGAYIAASQAGFAESEWAQFAEVSAKMGVAFDTTGEKAGEMLKAWRSGMRLSMDQAAALAGTVNHIANSMNATAMDIGGVLQRQGAYLSAMGLTQTQSAALAATMLSGGATEEIAATASKNFMKALTVGFAASKSQLEVFDMLKLNPEKLAKQMQKAPEQAIVDVMQRLQKLAPDQLAPAMKMLFGDESIGPAAQIVKSVDGLVAAFEMAGDTAKTMGSLQAEFDSMGNTTQQQMKKAGEGVKVVTTALGAGLLPSINASLAAFAPMALGVGQWMQANQGLVTTVVAIIAAIMAFKIAAIAGAYAFTFLKGAWLAGQAVLLTLRTAWMLHTGALVAGTAASRTAVVVSKALTAAQWLFNTAIGANPIGLLILGIVALVAAGVMLYKYWEPIKAFFAGFWQGFIVGLAPIGQAFRAAFGVFAPVVDAMRPGFEWLGGMLSAAWGWFSRLLAPVQSTKQSLDGATQAGQNFGLWLGNLVASFVTIIPRFFTFGAEIVSGIIGGITSKLTSLKDTVGGAIRSFVDSVRSILDAGVGAWITALLNFSPFGVLWNAITAALGALGIQVPEQFRNFGSFIMDGLIGGITGKLTSLKDTVVGAAESIAKWFSFELKIKSPSRVFTQFGGWISEGAAVGIEAGQAGVRAAALAMAGAALAPVASAGTGTAAGPAPVASAGTGTAAGPAPVVAPGTAIAPSAAAAGAAPAGGGINITIHAAPGMDAQAVARAVAAELDKRERQKSSRAHSGMYDRS